MQNTETYIDLGKELCAISARIIAYFPAVFSRAKVRSGQIGVQSECNACADAYVKVNII